MAHSVVELGFLEKPEDFSVLTSPFFPSKVGGLPAWLDPQNLPSPSQLACGVCGRPCVFLLQMYAPLADTHHRSLFLFMCREGACHEREQCRGGGGSRAFVVLRCALPRENRFYRREEDAGGDGSAGQGEGGPVGEEPSTETSVSGSGGVGTEGAPPSPRPLCAVCGCWGPKRCGGCHSVAYCSQDHQRLHWTAGHRLFCRDIPRGGATPTSLIQDHAQARVGVVLPQFEIVTEDEPERSVTCVKSDKERMQEYRRFVKMSGVKCVSVKGACESGEEVEDKWFTAFKKRISLEPEQVVRYQRDSAPLLVSGDHAPPPPSSLPRCGACGEGRVFEVQVMPQLIYYLRQGWPGGVDWGTLLLYTCAADCTSAPGYQKEFLWKQNFSSS